MNTELQSSNPTAYQRILVAYDDSESARRALDEAIAIARMTRASLRLMAVFDEYAHVSGFEPADYIVRELVPMARGRCDAMLHEACERAAAAGVDADTVLIDGDGLDIAPLVAAQAIAWPADLVVAGTQGRQGVDRALLGSIAESILRRCPVPMLAVHASTIPAQSGARAGA